jgi:hypothetical protein
MAAFRPVPLHAFRIHLIRGATAPMKPGRRSAGEAARFVQDEGRRGARATYLLYSDL